MNPLSLYWYRDERNFGDCLSPLICEILSKRPIQYADPDKCDIAAIGSILQCVKHGWFRRRIHIWGTGFIKPGKALISRHYYHSVRGVKTAARIKSVNINNFGDPGLLCDLIFPEHSTVTKKYLIGIVPHYLDRNDSSITDFVSSYPSTLVLDVASDIHTFLRDIASCDFILSSSLHGLIAADAFSIPNAWLKLSGKIRGNDFKFIDYYSVFGIDDAQVFSLREIKNKIIEDLAEQYQRPGLVEIKKNIIKSFPFLPSCGP